MKIDVKGPIIFNEYKWIYNWLDMESTSPRDVAEALEEADGEDVEVHINSGGGYVDAGSEIYTILKDYSGKVDVKIVGLAASAASVIAMAGDTVKISPTAQIMIHNVSSGRVGDYRDMEHEAGVLKNYNKSIANAYILKTGMEQEELLKLMDKETWLNAQQAKEYGFVDEIMFDEGNQLVASNSNLIPSDVISKVKNLLLEAKENRTDKNKEEQKDKKQDKQDNQIKAFKEKLAYKNKQVASYLFCQKQGGVKHV